MPRSEVITTQIRNNMKYIVQDVHHIEYIIPAVYAPSKLKTSIIFSSRECAIIYFIILYTNVNNLMVRKL